MNQFYVGSKEIARSVYHGTSHEWARKTLAEATERARESMENEDLEVAIVVKIVRVLYRQTDPVKVMEV